MKVGIFCALSILLGLCRSQSVAVDHVFEAAGKGGPEFIPADPVIANDVEPAATVEITTPDENEDKGTCKEDIECDNGGKCVIGNGGLKECVCRRGTSGKICENVDECLKNAEKCGKETDVQCAFSIDRKMAVCKCDDVNKSYNPDQKKCTVKCDDKNPCKNFGKCLDGACKCLAGTSGEYCQDIRGCPDCGNPDISTCLYDMQTQVGKCFCSNEALIYDGYDKSCKKCDCGKKGVLCSFEEGRKSCACPNGFADFLGKCTKCDCGLQTLDCAFSEEGDKVCTCAEGYSQKYDTCERCDCGPKGFSCDFDGYEKRCRCYSTGQEMNGTCYDCYCGEGIDCTLTPIGEKICPCKNGSGVLNGRCTECKCGLGVNCTFSEEGEKQCLCPDGYETRNGKCSEIDYCIDDKDCPFSTECRNYRCRCNEGYKKRSPASYPKIDGCDGPCDSVLRRCQNGGKCVDGTCACLKGTSGDFCQDVPACEDRDCGARRSRFCAYNVKNQRAECFCDQHRYRIDFNEFSGICEECVCGKYGECIFPGGKKTCNCYEGFGYVRTATIAPDTCQKCDCGLWSAGCTYEYSIYSKKCTCPKGFVQNNYPTEKCQRCDCGEHGKCSFSSDKKICTCNEDYLPKNGYCEECNCGKGIKCEFDGRGKKICHCPHGEGFKFGKCSACDCGLEGVNCTFNFKGNKSCSCPPGFEEKGGQCEDVDECQNSNACPFSTKCVNRNGTYDCICAEGFQKLSGSDLKTRGCDDIDECAQKEVCSSNAVCVNSMGSYDCMCFSPYTTTYTDESPRGVLCTHNTSDSSKTAGIVFLVVIIILSVFFVFMYCKNRTTE